MYIHPQGPENAIYIYTEKGIHIRNVGPIIIHKNKGYQYPPNPQNHPANNPKSMSGPV